MVSHLRSRPAMIFGAYPKSIAPHHPRLQEDFGTCSTSGTTTRSYDRSEVFAADVTYVRVLARARSTSVGSQQNTLATVSSDISFASNARSTYSLKRPRRETGTLWGLKRGTARDSRPSQASVFIGPTWTSVTSIPALPR